MDLVAWLARRSARPQLGALVGLAVLLALGGGATIAATEAAHRTDRAYASYLEQAEVGDLVVNPSLPTDRAAELIASTPGVSSYTSDSMLTASADDGHPRTQAEVDSSYMQLRASTNGRYTDDRSTGRPTRPDDRRAR